MSFLKHKNPLVVGVLILFIFFTNTTKTAAQLLVNDPPNLVVNTTTAASSATMAGLATGQTTKEFIGDSFANFVAKMILQKLTAQTVNWINSGFKGNPAFVTDPSQFFLDVGDNVASHYLSNDKDLVKLCSPFKAQVRLALVKNYIQENNNYTCTLSTIKNNYEAFTRDFSQGGWDGWFEMTQTSGGNPYNAYFAAQNQLNIEIGTQNTKYQKQLEWGNGILSYERCKKSATVGTSAQNLDGSISNDCAPWQKETVTPGSVINDQLSKALGSPWASLEAADEINEIVTALMQQLIAKVVGGVSGGLRSLSSSNTTSPGAKTFMQQVIDATDQNSQETQDFIADVYSVVPSDLGGTAPSITSGIPNFTLTPGGGGGSGGACGALMMPGATSMQLTVRRAMDAVMADTTGPDWSVETDIEKFKMAVVAQLNSQGEVAAAGWNGNCNNSANNLAIQTGPTTGEMYEIARDVRGCRDEVNPTVAESEWCRPNSGFTGPWSYISTGQTPPGFVRGSGGGGVGGVTVTPAATPVITGLTPTVNIVAGQTTIRISGTNLTGTVRFTDSNGVPYTASGSVNATKTETSAKVPAGLPGGTATVKVFLSASILSNAWTITVDGAPTSGPGLTATDATPGWRGGLAHNTNNDTWLVVSESSNGIYGRIMNNDGTAVGQSFKIDGPATTQALAPKVSYASDIQKFLVVWYDTPGNLGGTVYGRFIGATGAIEDLVSIAQDSSLSTIFNPNGILRYDSVNRQFVYVWEGSDNVYLRALDTNKVFGNIVKVTEGGTRHFSPAVAVKTDGSEYCVAYDNRSQGGVGVKRVDAILGTTGAETFATNAVATDVSIVYNSTDNKYLVTWSESGSIKGKFINSCNGADGGDITTIKTGLIMAVSAYNRSSNTYGIIGQNSTNIANGYVVLSSQGTVLRSGDVFGAGASNGNFLPVMAPNVTDGRFGASSAKDRTTTRFVSDL